MTDEQNTVPATTLPGRRVLTSTTFDEVAAAVRAATDTASLVASVLPIVYNALLAPEGRSLTSLADGERLRVADYQIPTVQWNAIVTAVTGRAQQWGTAAEVGLELALGLMPGHYHQPGVANIVLELPDYRPVHRSIVVTREASGVIAACETHLSDLREAYGPRSAQYLEALHTWHRNLSALLTMNTGPQITVSKDGPLSLFVRCDSGLVYALIFHGDTRRCTTPGCRARIADDGTTSPTRPDTAVPVHEHTPSYPLQAPQPGTWTFHS